MRQGFRLLAAAGSLALAGAAVVPWIPARAAATYDIGVSIAPASDTFNLGAGQAQWFVTVYNLAGGATAGADPTNDIVTVQGQVDPSEPTSPAEAGGAALSISVAPNDGTWVCNFDGSQTMATGPGFTCTYGGSGIAGGTCTTFTMQLDQGTPTNPPTNTANITGNLADSGSLDDTTATNDQASAMAAIGTTAGPPPPAAPPTDPPPCTVPAGSFGNGGSGASPSPTGSESPSPSQSPAETPSPSTTPTESPSPSESASESPSTSPTGSQQPGSLAQTGGGPLSPTGALRFIGIMFLCTLCVGGALLGQRRRRRT